jgi:urease accessory protein
MTIASTPTRTEGHLRLRAELVGTRTRLTELECRAPLQLMRTHHLDAALPDMAQATIVSPSGGVLQGDRLEVAVQVGPGARLRLDTPSATRLYRMPHAPAEQLISFTVEDDGYLEYLPEPTIPFAGSQFSSSTTARVAEDGTLVLAEVVSAGRAANGEVHQFRRYRSIIDLGRPGGEVLARDVTALDPADRLRLPGRLGAYAALGSLYVVHRAFDVDVLRDAIPAAARDGMTFGASRLPGELGAWLKVLGPDGPSVAAAVAAAAAAAHCEITGHAPPASRRPGALNVDVTRQ